MPQEFTSSFLFLWITPLNTLRRVEKSTFSGEKNGKKAEFSVQNTCDTLPEGDLNRLFDRFYRADASRARESGGYGIGLSVAAAIVKAHKGKITAERTRDGICFKAVFPAKG
jgi:signal transduction histidine kinase